MYERMLDKKREAPTFGELIAHAGQASGHWQALDEWLGAQYAAERMVRFPYGNDYGWGAKYSKGKRHICDVFAEAGAFSLLFQVSEAAVQRVYAELDEYARGVWANMHPCASGGWVDYRVRSAAELEGAKKLLAARMSRRK